MAALQSKAELQNQLDSLGKQIEKLAVRKGSLESELSQVLSDIEKREETIREAMITGADYSKDLDTQQRDKSKAESLRGAIVQASKSLEDLSAEKVSKSNKIGMIDLLAADSEVDEQILFALQKIKDAITSIEEIKERLAVMNTVASNYGLQPDFIDETKGSLDVYHYIRQWVTPEGSGSFRYQLNQLEQSYPAKLQAMREKRAG